MYVFSLSKPLAFALLSLRFGFSWELCHFLAPVILKLKPFLSKKISVFFFHSGVLNFYDVPEGWPISYSRLVYWRLLCLGFKPGSRTWDCIGFLWWFLPPTFAQDHFSGRCWMPWAHLNYFPGLFFFILDFKTLSLFIMLIHFYFVYYIFHF